MQVSVHIKYTVVTVKLIDCKIMFLEQTWSCSSPQKKKKKIITKRKKNQQSNLSHESVVIQ